MRTKIDGIHETIEKGKTMGKPRNPKVEKPAFLRGEKWTLQDGTSVIVLEKMRGGFVRCFGERGFMRVEHQNNFKVKEKSA